MTVIGMIASSSLETLKNWCSKRDVTGYVVNPDKNGS